MLQINKIIVVYSFFVFALFVPGAQASLNADWIKNDLPKYEKQLLKELSKTDKKKHFGLYVLAGRSFYNHGQLAFSEKYYKKAIQEKSKLDKSEPYFKLVHISFRKKNWKQMNRWLKKAKTYWKSHPKFAAKSYTRAITFYEASHPKAAKSIVQLPNNEKVDDGISISIAEHNFYAHFRNKKYVKALKDLDAVAIRDRGFYHQKVEYDLLAHLTSKEKPKSLLCDSFHKRYPSSYSYEVIICDALNSYRKDGKVKKGQLKRLSKYFSEFDHEMKFLVQAVKSLK